MVSLNFDASLPVNGPNLNTFQAGKSWGLFLDLAIFPSSMTDTELCQTSAATHPHYGLSSPSAGTDPRADGCGESCSQGKSPAAVSSLMWPQLIGEVLFTLTNDWLAG